MTGLGIFGCGGSNITPFGTQMELSEDEIYATLSPPATKPSEVRPLLMICHTPALQYQVRSNHEWGKRSAAAQRASSSKK